MPTTPTIDHDPLGYEVLRNLRRILRRVSDHSRRISREAGLTLPQLLVLKAVGEAATDEYTPAMVSADVQLSPATVSGILDRLERSGCLVRERRSQDRRRVCLSLTEVGEAKLASLPSPLEDRFLDRLAKLPDAEREGVLAALDTVVRLMEAEEIDAAPVLATDVDMGRPT